jgi:hypothetical protein
LSFKENFELRLLNNVGTIPTLETFGDGLHACDKHETLGVRGNVMI